MNNAFNATMDCARKLCLNDDDHRELRGNAKGLQRLLKQYERACQRGDKKAAKYCCNKLLGSFDAKMCATVLAIKVQPGEVVPTFGEIKDCANALNPFLPIAEPVLTWFEPKIVKGYRHLVAFGWSRRALQILCAHILSLAYPAASFDFTAKGKGGVPAAIKYLLKMIEQGGYEYVVTADVEKCFGSATKKKVCELLPLPEKVVNNVLLIQDGVKMVVKQMKTGKTTGQIYPDVSPTPTSIQADEAARLGVPQGSPASGTIMYRAVLGPLLSTLPFADRIVLIGDDLAVPVKDMSEGNAVLATLTSLYAASPVGLLTIGRSDVSHIKAGFNFAGYRMTLKRKWVSVIDPTTGVENEFPGPEWHMKARPSPFAYEKMEHKAAKRFQQAGGGDAGWEEVSVYVDRWMGAFPLWKPNEISKGYLWSQLQAGSWH